MTKPFVSLLVSGFALLFVFYTMSTSSQSWASPPGITDIVPNTGRADEQTAVTIAGHDFVITSTAYLNGIPLLDVTYVDSATLQARVPFGLPLGVYTLTVTNPEVGTLFNAFTVTAGGIGWSTGGPYGGRTHSIVIHPEVTTTVYVAAENSGLYRTTDSGERWELAFPNSVAGFIETWLVSPTVVFYGGVDGLYRSDRSGEPDSWSRLSFGMNDPLAQPNALVIAPSAPYTMYCATGNNLFYSSDGGLTWQDRHSGLPYAPWLLAVDPNDAATVYASYQDGTLYKTTTAGQSWQTLPYSIPLENNGRGGIWVMATDPYTSNTLWLGTWQQGLHRSVDGGQTFAEVTSFYTVGHQSGVFSLYFDPNQDRIFVGVAGPNDTIYFSDDSGDSWHGLSLSKPAGRGIAVMPNDSDTIYTTGSGVSKSTDEGQSWTWLSEGIAAIQPTRIAVAASDPQRAIMVSFDDGVFGTSNYGNEWLTYEIGAYSGNYQSVAIDPISPNIAYVGSAAEVYKTEDDGQTWQMTPGFPITGLPDNYWVHPIFLAIHPLTHTTVYAGVSYFTKSSEIINDGGLYRSDDGADSWVRITTTGPITPVSRITWAPGHPEILYLGTGTDCHLGKGNGIWRSRDSGQTWEHPDQLRGLSVPVLAVHPDNPDFLLAGVWCGMDNDQGIYWSDDAGNSWHLTTGLNSWDERRVSDIAYDPIDPGIIYAATVGGLRISFDGGNSWQAYPGPMGRLPVTALTLVQDGGQTRLYIGTVGGATSGQLSTLAGARPESAQILGGGVYTGQPRWHSVYLPLVRNKAQ